MTDVVEMAGNQSHHSIGKLKMHENKQIAKFITKIDNMPKISMTWRCYLKNLRMLFTLDYITNINYTPGVDIFLFDHVKSGID